MHIELRSALAAFRTLSNPLFPQHVEKVLAMSLDDILLYSNSRNQHIQHSLLVLRLPPTNFFFDRVSEYELATTESRFLSLLLENGGIIVGDGKSGSGELSETFRNLNIEKLCRITTTFLTLCTLLFLNSHFGNQLIKKRMHHCSLIPEM